MPDRPQTYCRDCAYQWTPRDPARADRCPGCRGPNVAAVMSLDDAGPAAKPSLVPKVLTFLIAGAALHVVAGILAVHLLRDNPAPAEPEVAAAKPAVKAPAPKPAPRPAPKPPEIVIPPPAPDVPPPKVPEPMPVVPEPPPVVPEPPKPPEPPPKSAPEPPPSPFPPPAGSWASKWEKAGDVRVRVAGVAVTKVPLEGRKKKFLSPDPYFVVWVEVENVSKADHTYRRWQPTTTGECTLRYAAGGVVGAALYPPESGREWFTEFTRPLPAGAPPVLESLVFSRPDAASDGPLSLTLDAARAGGTGRVTVEIPYAVWARR